MTISNMIKIWKYRPNVVTTLLPEGGNMLFFCSGDIVEREINRNVLLKINLCVSIFYTVFVWCCYCDLMIFSDLLQVVIKRWFRYRILFFCVTFCAPEMSFFWYTNLSFFWLFDQFGYMLKVKKMKNSLFFAVNRDKLKVRCIYVFINTKNNQKRSKNEYWKISSCTRSWMSRGSRRPEGKTA